MREVFEWHVGMGGNDRRVGYTLAADHTVEECHGCYFEPSASDNSERRREIEEAHRIGVRPSRQRRQVDRRSVLLIVFVLLAVSFFVFVIVSILHLNGFLMENSV